MYCRNACVIQIEIVISCAPNVQSPSAGNQYQRSFAQAFRRADPGSEVNLVFVFLSHTFSSGATSLLQILLLSLCCEVAEGRSDAYPTGGGLALCFTSPRRRGRGPRAVG